MYHIKLLEIFGHCLHVLPVLGEDGWQPEVVGGDVADPVLLLSPGQLSPSHPTSKLVHPQKQITLKQSL